MSNTQRVTRNFEEDVCKSTEEKKRDGTGGSLQSVQRLKDLGSAAPGVRDALLLKTPKRLAGFLARGFITTGSFGGSGA